MTPNDNVFGIPWVIAAKKGLPNFNEYGVMTTLEMTRKLEINMLISNLRVISRVVITPYSLKFGRPFLAAITHGMPKTLSLGVNAAR